MAETYHHSSLSPPPIPMPRDIRHPIPLPPNRRPNTNLLIQLHTHLEIPLERRLRDLQRAAHGRVALEPARVQHCVVVAFLVRLVAARRRVDGRWRGAVDRFSQDRVLRVVLLHGGEVVGAFEEVLALAGGVFCADGLAVDALC